MIPPNTPPKLLSPTRLFIMLLLTVAAVELLVMLMLPYLVPDECGYVGEFLDSLLLATLSAPFLWFLIVRPLRSVAMTEAFRASALLINMDNAVISFDAQGRIESLNPAAERMFGYELPEVQGTSVGRLIPDLEEIGGFAYPEKPLSLSEPGGRYCRETLASRKDGSGLAIEVSVTDLVLEGHPFSIAIANDITERRSYQEQLEYQANHDELTGLPNRNLLNDRIRQALLMGKRRPQEVAVFFIDLDNFKFFNETLGHDVGDQILKLAAVRLQACVRSEDTVARQGGDEFVILVASSDVSGSATFIATKILQEMARPFQLQEHELVITCSIGISIFPRDGEDVQTLVKHADVAMFRAKDQGRNGFQFYTAEMNASSLARLNMEKHLRRALERRELLVHYQPKVCFRSGRIVGMEALVRWRHPDLGLVSPGVFIPLAEETGLIEAIGAWVLREACLQNRRWQDAGFPPLTVAVNLSVRQLRQPDLARFIEGVLAKTGLDPRWLELELTESMVMQDVDRALEVMHELKAMGVSLSMDDFGTGYSSLSYLKRLPFDKLKIDQAFVRDITTDPDNAAIAKAVIAIAHSLNLKAIAEGVETPGQLGHLSELGCDELQGYYFSRPVPADDFTRLLAEGRTLTPVTNRASALEPTLLLVDDEPEVLAALQRLFVLEGYRVLTAESAAEGFELLATNRVGVVIVDQQMPVMTGTEFLGRIRELYPRVVRVILSGHADLNTATEAINRGEVYRLLSKPWDEAALLDTVKSAFNCHAELTAAGDRGPACIYAQGKGLGGCGQDLHLTICQGC